MSHGYITAMEYMSSISILVNTAWFQCTFFSCHHFCAVIRFANFKTSQLIMDSFEQLSHVLYESQVIKIAWQQCFFVLV